MMLWARRGLILGLLGTGSATAADGPKLEPPARPTRSEVEGTAIPPAPLLEAPPEAENVATVLPSREGLAPIYRPPAPPVPILKPPTASNSTATITTQPIAPPTLEGPTAITLEAVPDLSKFDPKPRETPVKPVQPPQRADRPPLRIEPRPARRGFFGFFRREPDAGPYAPSPRATAPPSPSMSSPDSDPSADSTLRRKVKAQADRTLGRHLRALDVRVIDQKIAIRARADFFWNKRAIRKALANLPAIQGHETTIQVD